MEKPAKQGSQGSVAGRSGCGVSEAEQADLRYPPRPALDPAPNRKVREHQGDPSGHAQAESAVGHSSPQALYPLPAGHSQIS